MGFLSHFWGGSFTSSNGPDWLVSNDNLGPVLDRALESIELCSQHIIGGSILSLLEVFSDANNGIQSSFLCLCDLGSNDRVSLTEKISPLRVTNDNPVDIKVLQLFGADLSGECSLAGLAHILRSDDNIWIGQCFDRGDVHCYWSNDNFDLGIIKLGLVDDIIDEVLDRLHGAIALPVATDDVFSRNT